MTHHSSFDAFVETIAALRAPGGCPWDREQTHASIASNMLEEAYEAVDAIEADDIEHLREELGDVLLQVVLQSQIAEDAGEFTIDDVCADINEKMFRRHPHVFGTAEAASASDVTAIWDSVKLTERGKPEAAEGKALLEGIPASLPALMQAQKISRKAVSAGFEWETLDDVWAQVFAEIDELKDAYAKASKDAQGKVSGSREVELEVGDVLFSFVNVARKMGVDAEGALRAACRKFRSRWAFIEGAAWASGREVEQLSLEEMEEYWTQAKHCE